MDAASGARRMTRMIYIANIRLPTEKAHGLQIMQNCEAFAEVGADVSLWVTNRINTAALASVRDLWAHYGVRRNFRVRRLPCLDLLPLVPNRSDRLAQVIFLLQLLTFTLSALIGALFTPADVYYSRDPLVLLALSLVKPRRKLAYEAHQLASGRVGATLQRWTVRRVGHVFATTGQLAADLRKRGAQSAHVAHDGVRRDRFANLPNKSTARAQLGWRAEGFIVGYVGRLHTMEMDKGVGTLVDALAQVGGTAIALVGGPDDRAAQLRDRWIAAGLPEDDFLYAGQVAPDQIPLYLRAFDVCTMPFPFTPHFAYHASPLKLFEYMAARRAIVASDLPSTREVVTDGASALLTPPSDVIALAEAIRQLRDDFALRQRLADQAYNEVMTHYTWDARAAHILNQLGLTEEVG
ncbi:MAG: glycosyltransferase family 4 protein [Anaerolineae bacterium]|nr:glycosyltransferase family 4 protein [Anaerolineae bacterium]